MVNENNQNQQYFAERDIRKNAKRTPLKRTWKTARKKRTESDKRQKELEKTMEFLRKIKH